MAPILFLSLTLSVLLATAATTSGNVTVQELDAALSALRSRGYTLFPNAITTSDIGLLLLSLNSTFTLFSPPDLLVFSLDLSSTATDYVHYLLRHVSPFRLSMADLRSIRGNPYLDTLIAPHRLLIDKSVAVENGTVLESVLVDGVRVLNPDLFLGSSIAVHGLGGILVSEFGSGVEEGKIDHFVHTPAMSPVAWPERKPPAVSPMVQAARGGDFITEPRGKKMEGKRNNLKGDKNLGVHVNLGGFGDSDGLADGDYALFSHPFGG